MRKCIEERDLSIYVLWLKYRHNAFKFLGLSARCENCSVSCDECKVANSEKSVFTIGGGTLKRLCCCLFAVGLLLAWFIIHHKLVLTTTQHTILIRDGPMWHSWNTIVSYYQVPIERILPTLSMHFPDAESRNWIILLKQLFSSRNSCHPCRLYGAATIQQAVLWHEMIWGGSEDLL